MHANKTSTVAKVICAVLFAVYAVWQGPIRTHWAKFYASGKGIAGDLAPDQILLQLFGFREFLAGILWVRADGFFDEGNYDGVLPIIRICTILDPKQIDIFSTGMWHIAYNFTDEEQRSDRRYVASALALGKEGSFQNPNTYEIFFETGWIWYHKIDDEYHQAVKWFELAHQRKDIQQGRRNLLANAYQRNGEIMKAVDLYYSLLQDAETIQKQFPQDFGPRQMRDTIENNLDTLLVRMVQRGWLAKQRGDFAPTSTYDTNPPFDTGFSVRATIEEPLVMNIVGTWNVAPVGTRIRVVLRDANNPTMKFAEMDWDGRNTVDFDPDRSLTFMQDSLFVKSRRFKKRIDMSRDPTMYPFSPNSTEYLLEFYYNPRSAPAHIQDKFGFEAEGFTDKNFLNKEARKNYTWTWGAKDKQGWTPLPELKERGGDQPVMYTSFKVSRDQIWRRGEWADVVPVLQTKNFDASKAQSTTTSADVIQVPTMRPQGAK